MNSGTSLAPILFSLSPITLKEYTTGGRLICITSLILIILEAFTLVPPIMTLPFLQASAAMVRVLNRRTAHIHLSMRTSSFSSFAII